MENFNINRRRFLQSAAASLALTSFGAMGMDAINPAKPYRVALIGTGWYGKSDLFRLIQVVPVEVIALCDVDKNMLKNAGDMVSQRQKSGKIPLLYGNYKKMLAENQLDLVLIGTPDHWHPLQMIDAVKAGAHVYVQKPISVDVLEGEAMVAAAQKYNKVVQVGTQRKSTPHIIEAKKNIIDTGLLGKIKHVEMCCYYHMRSRNTPDIVPIPDFFDYEMWTGPAPIRPYTGLPHRGWRAYKENGNGIMGDMCIHMLDTARWMLGLGWPKKISSVGGIYVDKAAAANIPDTQTAVFEYEELNCIWQHRSWGTATDSAYPWALFVYGEKGTLKISPMQYDFIPEDKAGVAIHKDVIYEREKFPEDVTEKDIELHAAPATRFHMLDFITAIEKKTKPVADIHEGHISTASCILANISLKLGRPVKYDPVKHIVVGDKEATAMLSRKYRSPWVHPT
jgi:predicted dehydrogenase